MNPVARKLLWWVLGLAVAGCVTLELLPRPHVASRLQSLPLRGLGYAGRDLPLNESEQTVFQRTPVLKRLYQVGGSRMVLLAVDGDGDRHAIHDPLFCFRGAGWTVDGETETPLPGGSGRIVHLRKGAQAVDAMYWITDGTLRHASPMQAWWQSATRRLSVFHPGPAPVLILLQPVTGTTVNWQDVLGRFSELTAL